MNVIDFTKAYTAIKKFMMACQTDIALEESVMKNHKHIGEPDKLLQYIDNQGFAGCDDD